MVAMTITFVDGRKYIGEYKDNERNGQGPTLIPMDQSMSRNSRTATPGTVPNTTRMETLLRTIQTVTD